MFRTFLKTAYRNLSKNKLFTSLNVIGLALGMSIGLLFVAFLSFLTRYDDFHPNKERIFRVTTQLYDNYENPHYASAPVALAQKLEEEMSGVDKVVRIHRSLYGEAVYGDKKIWLGGYFADPEFLEVFNFPLLQGNKETALTNPNSVIISETEAKKIFGSENAVGEMIKMEPYGDFLVTGVFQNLPENSHMQFSAVASYTTLGPGSAPVIGEKESWKSFTNSFVYVRLMKDYDPFSIEKSLNEIAEEKYPEKNLEASFELQGLEEIVPGPPLVNQIGPNYTYLGLFLIGSMVLIILIPACSNYAHLSIAQSLERMKEIGVRKVMGGQKKHIFFQFIVESVTIVLLALVFAYIIFEIIRKDFLSQMVETAPMDLTPTPETYLGFIFFALLVGLAAGAIPALYFSKIEPIIALKGKEIKSRSRFSFRKIVLTSQFMLSLGFIMAVVIMMRQYQFSINYDFGFEQQDVLDVELQNVDPQIFEHEYGKLSSLQKISMSSHILGVGSAPETFIKFPHQQDSLEASSISIDEDFISNLKLDLTAGTGFGDNASKNSRLIIVNEEFADKLTVLDSAPAIGRRLLLPSGKEVMVAGIVKNFHYADLKSPIKNFFFEYDPESFNYANVKLQSHDLAGTLAAMEQLWKKIDGEGQFTAQLLSNEIKDAYNFYKTIIKLWGFLGLMAITVACLGLLGTVSFNIKKRFKEISIRKVLGASSKRLVLLLSKDFIILMVIASLITIPVVYFIFTHLLSNTQHYSIEIGFLEIIVSLIVMMLFGLSTILSQTLKAANTNPAENLRSE